MKEKAIQRSGEMVVEVRSKAGKLLYIKTDKGYELKCPRSKEICLIPYTEMLSDCLSCLKDKDTPSKAKTLEILKYIEENSGDD